MTAGAHGRILYCGPLIVSLTLWPASCAMRRVPPSNATAAGIEKRTGLSLPPQPVASDQRSLPPGFTLDSPLSSDQAAALALWNNRRLNADLAALGVAEADLLDAGLLRNPRFDVLFPVGAKPLEMLLNLPVDAFIQRPRRIAASQAAYDQLAESLIQNGLNTIRDARLAHADFLQAASRVDVADRAAALRTRISQLTEARL